MIYHESMKSKYEQRVIDVDKATFCPLVECTVRAVPSVSKALKQLASKLSDSIYPERAHLHT